MWLNNVLMLMIFVKKFDENECGDMMWWDFMMLLWKVMMKNMMIFFYDINPRKYVIYIF